MPTRVTAALGLGGIAVCVVLIGLLHPIAADIDPIRRTISQYALGEWAWMFNVGVIGLAVGSALVLIAHVRSGTLRWTSRASLGLAAWAVALLLVVVFEKANWSVGPSVGGYIHRYASLVAFFALPTAALALGRQWRSDALWGRFAAWTRALGLLSFGWLAVILASLVLGPLNGVAWWRFIPIGLVERGLALSEVAAVVVMGLWAYRASQVPVPAAHPVPAPVAAA